MPARWVSRKENFNMTVADIYYASVPSLAAACLPVVLAFFVRTRPRRPDRRATRPSLPPGSFAGSRWWSAHILYAATRRSRFHRICATASSRYWRTRHASSVSPPSARIVRIRCICSRTRRREASIVPWGSLKPEGADRLDRKVTFDMVHSGHSGHQGNGHKSQTKETRRKRYRFGHFIHGQKLAPHNEKFR
ncbi:hypothetical protein LMG26411_03892 [Cupriavidus numazuensis]|uniref:Uncharacterized protein n=1 Tax=Cupriavidus numazuensis TaxID=221992 RepID=A0ABN7Q0D1_9BURK|nr:hypothetical protein LMG26411_03892 [Cupriavidus numazuensis]